MSRLLPHRPPVETGDAEPRVLDLGEDDAGETFEVLSSTTARRILARLYEAPGTQSDVARDVETSLQNVGYHLGNLEAAGLVEVVDQWYSEKGSEMNVYAPTGEPLLLMAGDTSSVAAARQAVNGGLASTGVRSVGD